MIEIAKKYWIRNLKPKETCHFELDSSTKYPTESKTSVPAINSTTTPSVWALKNISPEDIKLVNDLIADKIFSWEWELTLERLLIMLARVHWKDKNNS